MSNNIYDIIDTVSKYAGSNSRMDGPFRIMCIDAIRHHITAQQQGIEHLQEQRDGLLEAMEALQDDGIWGVAHEKAEQAMANARENE